MALVEYVHMMVYGLQCSLIKPEAPAPAEINSFFLSLATDDMARLAAELVPPISTSSFSESNHSRARAEAMSALFWWCAVCSSIFLPLVSPHKSSMAKFMAYTQFLPSSSYYTY